MLPSLCMAFSRDADEELVIKPPIALGDRMLADTTAVTDSILASDSVKLMPDTTPLQATAPDTTALRKSRIVREKVDLETTVDFSARDSMLIIRRDSAFMYGESSVTYGQIKLDAAQIEMDLSDNTVYAVGRVDSLGEVEGKPIFNDNGTEYEAATMRYNMASEKGFITNVVTQQGEGYLTGGNTKKANDGSFYTQNGFYTTCDDHECPHFGFQLTKAKIQPGKNIVTGPAYMVLAGLPLPLAVPFGYFPFTDSYSSGVIVPTFGDDYNRGFYLSNGGYYFAISDNIDAAITGEVYTDRKSVV